MQRVSECTYAREYVRPSLLNPSPVAPSRCLPIEREGGAAESTLDLREQLIEAVHGGQSVLI